MNPVPGDSRGIKPSLLDRITGGGKPESGALVRRSTREGFEMGSINAAAHRETVLRDMEWIFNSSSPMALRKDDWRTRYPEIASSVLNFGLREVFGGRVSDLDAVEFKISEGLAHFEPRLVVSRQKLRATQEGQLVEVQIEGSIIAQNADRRIIVRTDLETSMSSLELNSRG